jgi:hypothetical protein
MKTPIIYEIPYGTVVEPRGWKRLFNITQTKTFEYKKENRLERKFTDEFSEELVKFFTMSPPKVGDVVFIDGAYEIIKVFYNFNHDRYEIWWRHIVNYDQSSVLIDEDHFEI